MGARAGGVDVRVVMRCGAGRGAEVTMRGEYGRYCGWCGDDVEMVVRVHHDMDPHKGQSRAVVVRWHRKDPGSNSRQCVEIQSDSSSLDSTPSVVDVHVRNWGSSDESILKSTSRQFSNKREKKTALACPARTGVHSLFSCDLHRRRSQRKTSSLPPSTKTPVSTAAISSRHVRTTFLSVRNSAMSSAR